MIYNLTVEDILKCTNGKLIIGNKEDVCVSFSKDTRNIQKDDIYIGIKGERFDGNTFWKDALDLGAKGIIVQDILFTNEDIIKYSDKIVILVNDTLKALYSIATFKRSKYNIPVIAVTGSVGKTSTKDIIASVLSQKYNVLKTQGNNNNNIGMPFTILKLQDEDVMVLEMGMNHFGEIKLLTSIAKPTFSVITNVGTAHIGNLGSRENILNAKLEILEGMDIPKLVFNNDNDMLNNWYNVNKGKYELYPYGIENESYIKLGDIEYDIDFTKFKYNNQEFKINVGGKHFVYNAMSAIILGKILDISDDSICKGILEFKLGQKRMEIFKLHNGVNIINDTYNASLESVQSALEYLASTNAKRKIAVLGDMLELGKYSDELHITVGKEVVKNNIDILFCFGQKAKLIYDEAIDLGMKNAMYFTSKDEVLIYLREIIKEGDQVLFKASNGMKFFDMVEELKKES